ncbi:hypothetical protein GF312_00115 [Candidatus Poribacteria bacterium]|nr:hypothetical protein [Candidatus Poribacteria bacterium]
MFVNIIFAALAALLVIVALSVGIANLIRRRKRQEGTVRPYESPVDTTYISSEEIMDSIDAAIPVVRELEVAEKVEQDKSYESNKKWLKDEYQMQAEVALSLKELTIFNMKIAKSRPAVEVMAEVLSMNIPVDAIEMGQQGGKKEFPNYRAMAKMVWLKTMERLDEPIDILINIHNQRNMDTQKLIADLTGIIMREMKIPVSASGFAVLLTLIIAKIEFGAFSEEDDAEGGIVKEK